jgi:threonine dehydrogenase-like Zn-dependent dehydrogenase
MIFPAKSRTHKVPSTLSPEAAVYIEPLACSVHCVERADIQFNDVVVVSGCGPLGLGLFIFKTIFYFDIVSNKYLIDEYNCDFCVFVFSNCTGMIAAAKLKSPQLLIALDLLDFKLDVAKACGADVVLNVGQCDVVEEIRKLSEGYGCDVYIEATGTRGHCHCYCIFHQLCSIMCLGHPDSVKQGLQAISRLGRFIEFSVFGKETSVDWTIIGKSLLFVITNNITIDNNTTPPHEKATRKSSTFAAHTSRPTAIRQQCACYYTIRCQSNVSSRIDWRWLTIDAASIWSMRAVATIARSRLCYCRGRLRRLTPMTMINELW